MIDKVASNVDKQSIPPNKVTRVVINGRNSWKAAVRRKRYTWETTVQVELPASGLPNIIRFRFCRYPGTAKADYTGHFSYPVHPGMAGKEVWVTLSHGFVSGGSMPVGLYLDHDGAVPIVLDGRQVKAN
jgi:hypothetical protein